MTNPITLEPAALELAYDTFQYTWTNLGWSYALPSFEAAIRAYLTATSDAVATLTAERDAAHEALREWLDAYEGWDCTSRADARWERALVNGRAILARKKGVCG